MHSQFRWFVAKLSTVASRQYRKHNGNRLSPNGRPIVHTARVWGAKFVQLMLFLILDTSYVTDSVNHVYTFSDCEIVN